MRNIFYILLLAIFILPLNKSLMADDAAAHKLYLTAYETMKSADYLKEKGLTADSADMYLEALRLYQKIAEQYPDWQPDLVAFRIDYCRRAITGKKGTTKEIKTPISENTTDQNIPAGFGTNYNKVIVGPWRIEAKVKDDEEKEEAPIAITPAHSPAEQEKSDKIEDAIFEAKKAERSGDYVSALAIYSSVLEHKVNGEIFKGAIRSAIRVEDTYARRRFVELARKSNIVKDAELKYLFGVSYCMDQNFVQAAGFLQEATMQDPTNPLFRVALGVALAGCGKFNEAEAEMRKALSINSKIAEAYYNLAWIRLALKGKSAGGAMRADYQNALRYGADPDPILERNIP